MPAEQTSAPSHAAVDRVVAALAADGIEPRIVWFDDAVTTAQLAADALGVEAADLVRLPDREDVPIAATLDHEGAHAPRRDGVIVPPQPAPGLVALCVAASVGDYRAGDEVWLSRLAPQEYAAALNRDLLLPRPAGRFIFGRLIGREDGKLHILPLGAGQRQTVVTDPPWAAVAVKLIRNL